ncbi:MAG: ECF transporter S component [Lachnospiraceae bacterium]|nr:ECF transporter S component [Lachnospiraceae bacterium]
MKGKNNNSPWSLQFNTAALVLIPAAVGINYIGKLFAGVLKLPLWLDSIGTCLAACLAGPVVGAIAGAMNNLIYGLTMDPISTVYAFTQAAIGIVVGLMAYYGAMKNVKGALLTGILGGFAAVLISTPLNMIFWGGTTGNLWGDLAYAAVLSQNASTWIASTVDEIIVDVPDKIVVLLLVMGLYKNLPKSLLSLYQSNSKIESLD